MDAETYRSIVLEHKDRVHAYAYRLLHDLEEAKDVSQEMLVRLWEHRDRVRPEASRSWLLRGVYRLAIDRTRRRKVRAGVGETHDPERLVAASPSPERVADAGLIGDRLEAALGRLSIEDRAAVLLREVHGMRYEDIATQIDVPIGTLKAKLHRARVKLRGELLAQGVAP